MDIRTKLIFALVAVALGSMRVIYGNNPPVITEISAPDTVTIQAQSVTIDLSVHVEDPSGLKDINRVFFNTYRPDGSPAQGNPFTMYDDGSLIVHGDAVAVDAIDWANASILREAQGGAAQQRAGPESQHHQPTEKEVQPVKNEIASEQSLKRLGKTVCSFPGTFDFPRWHG